MNFFRSNLKILEAVDPETARLIRRAEESPLPIAIHSSPEGVRICSISSFHLYSRYDPLGDAERWALKAAAKIPRGGKAVIFGFGMGYHLEFLLKLDDGLKLTVIEPSAPLVRRAMEAVDLAEVLPRITLLTGAAAAKILREPGGLSDLPLVPFQPEASLWKDYYKELRSALATSAGEEHPRDSLPADTRREAEEILSALPAEERGDLKKIAESIRKRGLPGKAARALVLIEKLRNGEIS